MKKILIIEDDKYLANAHRVKFTKSGFEIMISYDGTDAIKTTSQFSPNLIILDLIMPMKDSFSVHTDIKANKDWAHIPVTVTSNLSQKEDIDRALKLGASDYIVKSNIDLNVLVEKINKLLS